MEDKIENYTQTFTCSGKYTRERFRKLLDIFNDMKMLGYAFTHNHYKDLYNDMVEIHCIMEKKN